VKGDRNEAVRRFKFEISASHLVSEYRMRLYRLGRKQERGSLPGKAIFRLRIAPLENKDTIACLPRVVGLESPWSLRQICNGSAVRGL
jgi:hypothetical protein